MPTEVKECKTTDKNELELAYENLPADVKGALDDVLAAGDDDRERERLKLMALCTYRVKTRQIKVLLTDRGVR